MAFLGFDHIDTRVRSVKSVEPFYDRLLPALGLTEKRYAFVDQHGDWHEPEAGRYNTVEYHEPLQAGRVGFFIGFIENAAMQPVGTRIAFRVLASELERWHADLQSMDARNIELSDEPDDYPAIFFEDPAGTKLELVARKPRP